MFRLALTIALMAAAATAETTLEPSTTAATTSTPRPLSSTTEGNVSSTTTTTGSPQVLPLTAPCTQAGSDIRFTTTTAAGDTIVVCSAKEYGQIFVTPSGGTAPTATVILNTGRTAIPTTLKMANGYACSYPAQYYGSKCFYRAASQALINTALHANVPANVADLELVTLFRGVSGTCGAGYTNLKIEGANAFYANMLYNNYQAEIEHCEVEEYNARFWGVGLWKGIKYIMWALLAIALFVVSFPTMVPWWIFAGILGLGRK